MNSKPSEDHPSNPSLVPEQDQQQSKQSENERAAQDIAFERDYVLIEKRAVEVNALADELTKHEKPMRRRSVQPKHNANPVMVRRKPSSDLGAKNTYLGRPGLRGLERRALSSQSQILHSHHLLKEPQDNALTSSRSRGPSPRYTKQSIFRAKDAVGSGSELDRPAGSPYEIGKQLDAQERQVETTGKPTSLEVKKPLRKDKLSLLSAAEHAMTRIRDVQINDNLIDAGIYPKQGPEHKMTAPPYKNTTRMTLETDVASQSNHAIDHSKDINHAGRFWPGRLEEFWHPPHSLTSTDPPKTTEDAKPKDDSKQPLPHKLSSRASKLAPRIDSGRSRSASSSPPSQQPQPQQDSQPQEQKLRRRRSLDANDVALTYDNTVPSHHESGRHVVPSSNHVYEATNIYDNATAVFGDIYYTNHYYNNNKAMESLEVTAHQKEAFIKYMMSAAAEFGIQIPRGPMIKDKDEVSRWVRETFEAQMYATTIWDGQSAVVPPSVGTSLAHLDQSRFSDRGISASQLPMTSRSEMGPSNADEGFSLLRTGNEEQIASKRDELYELRKRMLEMFGTGHEKEASPTAEEEEEKCLAETKVPTEPNIRTVSLEEGSHQP